MVTTNYTENPNNFHEIEQYVLIDEEQIVLNILLSDKCYFYDACSFINHVHMPVPDYLFKFIKKTNGIVVITRCILMELESHSGTLNSEYIEYIKKMYLSGLKVLIIYEEDVFKVLSRCFSENTIINTFLSCAVKTIKRKTGTIETTLQADKSLMKKIMGSPISQNDLYKNFFQSVRSFKESGDNLGEELIAVCIHILANIPSIHNYKYIVLTDDKGAIGLINKASKNVYAHLNKYVFSALTTARLSQRLYEEKIISTKNDINEILSLGAVNNIIKILGSEEYDLDIKEKNMTCNELAEKIITPNAIHINY